MLNRVWKDKNQRGIASLIIVGILVILLSLVSIGFTRLVNRDASAALESQKAQIASYAAESGINQVINYIDSTPNPKDETKCQNNLLNKLNSNQGLSGDNDTEYTCVLLGLTPGDLTYSLPDPLTSKVVKLSNSAPLTSLFVSWSPTDNSVPVPNNSHNLLDEAAWKNKNYMPILRLSVYAIPPNNLFSGSGYVVRTLFLYPNNSAGTNVINLSGNNPKDGSLVPVNCSAQSFAGFSYTSPGSQYCSVIFNNLPPNDTLYYLRLTPVYGAARAVIEAQDGSGDIKFADTQAVIDVTAKSNDVVKRLQARVDLNNSAQPPEADNIPEFALHSAWAICKRYVVSGLSVSIDAGSTYCGGGGGGGGGPPPPPPPGGGGNKSKIVYVTIVSTETENATVSVRVMGHKANGDYICKQSPYITLPADGVTPVTVNVSSCPDNEINKLGQVVVIYNNGNCDPHVNPFQCVYHHAQVGSVTYSYDNAPAKTVNYFSNQGACVPGKGTGPTGPYQIVCGTPPYVLNGNGALTFKTTNP